MDPNFLKNNGYNIEIYVLVIFMKIKTVRLA